MLLAVTCAPSLIVCNNHNANPGHPLYSGFASTSYTLCFVYLFASLFLSSISTFAVWLSVCFGGGNYSIESTINLCLFLPYSSLIHHFPIMCLSMDGLNCPLLFLDCFWIVELWQILHCIRGRLVAVGVTLYKHTLDTEIKINVVNFCLSALPHWFRPNAGSFIWAAEKLKQSTFGETQPDVMLLRPVRLVKLLNSQPEMYPGVVYGDVCLGLYQEVSFGLSIWDTYDGCGQAT